MKEKLLKTCPGKDRVPKKTPNMSALMWIKIKNETDIKTYAEHRQTNESFKLTSFVFSAA